MANEEDDPVVQEVTAAPTPARAAGSGAGSLHRPQASLGPSPPGSGLADHPHGHVATLTLAL